MMITSRIQSHAMLRRRGSTCISAIGFRDDGMSATAAAVTSSVCKPDATVAGLGETASARSLAPSLRLARFRAARGSGGERILGPFVLWISAAQLLAYLEIARVPEPRQIPGDLDRPVRRREHAHRHGDASVRHPRRLRQAEHFLKPNG